MIVASLAIICVVASTALVAASNPHDAARALPAGALKSSPSLYLRQAASSAIRWQQWGPEAFALSRSLNRPILIDIGAVWCHWCHVMDQTTYSDPEVAAILNREFVPVKVDSDERPDIDGYYQNAASHLTGAGGWPLTCFTTSSGALFFAAGYLPPRPGAGPNGSGGENSSMVPLMKRIADVYRHDRASLEHQAEATAAKLVSTSPATTTAPERLDAMRAQVLAGLTVLYDRNLGGFGSGPGPRFYDFPAIRLALAHGFFGHPEFTVMAVETLKKIAAGGVYDQLGGGFHRYSTDPKWAVPHFEKMAYDNAMALQAYAEAFEASRDPSFAAVAKSLTGYVNRELLDSKTHAFYSHQDADSFPGDDGSYYTWTVDEVRHLLPTEQARVAVLYFGLEDSPGRAPDGRIVLRRAMDAGQIGSRLKISAAEVRETIAKASAAMLAARERRKKPPVDHAIMTDRNALMAHAYLTASAALGDDNLRRIALDDLDFILSHLRDSDGSVFHVWADGRAQVTGLAADQVYLLDALVSAYEFSADERYLTAARSLASVILEKFRLRDSGLIVNRDDNSNKLPIKLSQPGGSAFYDMPMPSVNATAAIAIAKLAKITSSESYAKVANDLISGAPAFAGTMSSNNVATLGLALENRADGYAEVAIVGPRDDQRAGKLWQTALATYRPAKVVMRISDRNAAKTIPAAAQSMFAASAGRDTPLAFVCAGTAGSTPTDVPDKLADVIKRFAIASPGAPAIAKDHPRAAPPM